MHPAAFKNLSRISRKRVTIFPKHGSDRPKRYCAGVVRDDFGAEHAFAFGIDLQGHFSVMHLEHRQIRS
jgi:hypothetical protein